MPTQSAAYSTTRSTALSSDQKNTFVPLGDTRSDGLRVFAPPDSPFFEAAHTASELRVCVLTSVRDLGVGEHHGQTITTAEGARYMRGSLFHLLEATKHELSGRVRVVAIIVDDVPSADGIESAGYSVIPQPGSRALWIAPPEYACDGGKPLGELVVNIPSSFRKIARSEPDAGHRRKLAKLSFEQQVAAVAQEHQADLILSDSCLILFETLHHIPEWVGRVVNLHPGITWSGDPDECRGPSATSRALQHAAERAPTGTPFHQGSSLHFVADEMDGGEVICDIKRTPVYPNDHRDTLRYRNYQCSKLPLLVAGLDYIASHFDWLRDTYRLYHPQG